MENQKNQQATPTTAGKPQGRLRQVQRGILKEPLRYIFYGAAGLGKTTLAASAPGAICFDVEDGSGRLDVPRYMFRDEKGGHVPMSFGEIQSGIRDLLLSEHSYKTLILDTADRLESFIWRHILERDSGKVTGTNQKGHRLTNIEAYNFGRGYQIAVDEWRSFAAQLDQLRQRRDMQIIIIGHAQIRSFKSPTTADYDRWQLRVHEKASGFLKEWADVVGYIAMEEFADALLLDGDRGRAKGISTGRRLVHFRGAAGYDAKSRIPLPDELELDARDPWAPFAAAIEEGRSMAAPQILELIKAETRRIGDAGLTAKVRATCENESDTARLGRYLGDLRRRGVAEERQDSNETVGD